MSNDRRSFHGGHFARAALAPTLLFGLGAIACQGADPYLRVSGLATCTVERQECTVASPNGVSCLEAGPVLQFFADVCFDRSSDNGTAACRRTFCNDGVASFDVPGSCDTRPVFEGFAVEGVCTPAAAGKPLVAVRAQQHSTVCTGNFGDPDANRACSPLDEEVPSEGQPDLCIDVTKTPAMEQVATPTARHSRAWEIIDYTFGCTPAAALAFDVSPGPVATASGGGTSVTATAVRGQVGITQICGEGCLPTSVQTFRTDLADITVAGTRLTQLVVTSIGPAAVTDQTGPQGSFLGIGTGELTLRADGKINGVGGSFTVRNSSPWHVDLSPGFLRLRGGVVISGVGPNGGDVTINADVNSVPATPPTQACANLSSLARLFGFEDVQRWSSSQAVLSLVTAPLTQGCGALGIEGQGYMSIAGSTFTTQGLAVGTQASVDLFIPANQPNQFYLGALQMFLSCPSGAVNNQYIGQVELTGKPQNRYSTLRFPLSAAVRANLTRNLTDCSFTFGLNANPTGRKWLLDNLRLQ
jgi:hypothetical protein